jgi:hypothetical protein
MHYDGLIAASRIVLWARGAPQALGTADLPSTAKLDTCRTAVAWRWRTIASAHDPARGPEVAEYTVSERTAHQDRGLWAVLFPAQPRLRPAAVIANLAPDASEPELGRWRQKKLGTTASSERLGEVKILPHYVSVQMCASLHTCIAR